jgi:hypothetical protein
LCCAIFFFFFFFFLVFLCSPVVLVSLYSPILFYFLVVSSFVFVLAE